MGVARTPSSLRDLAGVDDERLLELVLHLERLRAPVGLNRPRVRRRSGVGRRSLARGWPACR